MRKRANWLSKKRRTSGVLRATRLASAQTGFQASRCSSALHEPRKASHAVIRSSRVQPGRSAKRLALKSALRVFSSPVAAGPAGAAPALGRGAAEAPLDSLAEAGAPVASFGDVGGPAQAATTTANAADRIARAVTRNAQGRERRCSDGSTAAMARGSIA